MSDYIPASDADFDLFRARFDKYLKDNLAALGLTAGDITTLNTLETAWTSALADFLTKRALLDAAVQLKNTTRQQLEDVIRALSQQLQSNPATTNDQRAGLGITVPDETRSRVPAPNTSPLGQVDTDERLQHTIHFRDSKTPDSKSKPEGYRGCQIWVFIGTEAPTSLEQLHYVATDTRTPYVLEFDQQDAGKNAYYRLRWVNTRDEPGPWSELIVATITG